MKHSKLDLFVTNGNTSYYLNEIMLNMQRCWSNLESLKDTHLLRLAIVDLMNETDNKLELQEYAQDITEIDFKLQELWKFPQEKRWHQFWLLPKCSCPKMDNQDDYPHVSYVDSGCVLHGDCV